MSSRTLTLLRFFVAAMICVTTSGIAAPQTHKSAPSKKTFMTNEDVIRMAEKKLPESVVINAIQSHKTKFTTSADDLIRLQTAGVTENEMNAMLAAANANSSSSTPPAVPAPSAAPATDPSSAAAPVAPSSAAAPASGPVSAPTPTRSRMPQVSFVANGAAQDLPLEKTQLAQTKTKPSSMTSLAADSAVTQALQAEIGSTTTAMASHIGSGFGSSSVQQVGGIFSGVLSHRKPTVTYVWGVPNPVSANVLPTASPTFSVDFSRTPGINPDDYEPAVVKLTPAQNTCRIVGATQGKEDASSDPAADWQIYSHFLEDRVAANARKQAKGKYTVTPASELLPGEYALVLRPVSKSKGFSGGDVARAQGDGLMFDAAWTFQISDSAQ